MPPPGAYLSIADRLVRWTPDCTGFQSPRTRHNLKPVRTDS